MKGDMCSCLCQFSPLSQEDFIPRLVNGRSLKARNQWYNKCMKELMSCLPPNKRNRLVNHCLHTASRWVINLLGAEGIGTLIILSGSRILRKSRPDAFAKE